MCGGRVCIEGSEDGGGGSVRGEGVCKGVRGWGRGWGRVCVEGSEDGGGCVYRGVRGWWRG